MHDSQWYTGLIMCVVLSTACGVSAGSPAAAVALKPGPHLLLDDYLIESIEHVERRVNRPPHAVEPIIHGGLGLKDFNVGYDVTVLKDEQSGRYRLWYSVPAPLPDLSKAQPVESAQTHVAYMESTDAVSWVRPFRELADPAGRPYQQFVVSVFDRGRDFSEPEARFVMGYGAGSDLAIALSPDGLNWKYLRDVPEVALKYHYDAFRLEFDPIRQRWIAQGGVNVTSEQLTKELGFETSHAWTERRRCFVQSTSDDLVNWTPATLLLAPDEQDPGATQFEGLYGVLARGDLLIGMVKTLRPDADPRGYTYGMQHTQLAWSRDGVTWTRERNPFLACGPEAYPSVELSDEREKKPWDYAFSSASHQLVVGDELYVYYVGIREGHKINRYTDRQIGLIKMPVDRYIARTAGASGGVLRTRLLRLNAANLSLNVDATAGSVIVRVIDESGTVVATSTPVTNIDSIKAPVEWPATLQTLATNAVRLEFAITHAKLYAFNLE